MTTSLSLHKPSIPSLSPCHCSAYPGLYLNHGSMVSIIYHQVLGRLPPNIKLPNYGLKETMQNILTKAHQATEMCSNIISKFYSSLVCYSLLIINNAYLGMSR